MMWKHRLFAAALGCLLTWLAAALELHFIDVGQGDAVLIRSETGQTALYDGGDWNTGALQYLRDLGVNRLDLVIASHNHADHIGGLVDIIHAYEPPYFMDNGIPHTTRTYEHLLDALDEADSRLLEPEARTIQLGAVSLRVLPPPGVASWGHNDNSVGVIIEYGAFRASLTGDAEPDQFEWWRERHADLFAEVHVHKSSHHGSVNGDTETSMALLSPETVVISCGRDNRYGHPHEETLALYARHGAEVYRTDLHGHVVVRAAEDGHYTVSTSRDGQGNLLSEDCVDINTASAEELQRIIHVGPAYARAIVKLRQERSFQSVEELTRVQGIGDGRLRDILNQGLACVTGAP